MRHSFAKTAAAAAVALVAVALTACGVGGDFIQVSAGGDHTCALRSDGSVVCWGDDEWGQLRAPEEERFTSIAAGGIHTCGLREDGTTACWGYDFSVRYPWWSDDDLARNAPVFPPGDERFASIIATASATCGMRDDRSIVCWDLNPERKGEFSPFESEQMVQMSGGPSHSEICGLREDGSGLCVLYWEYQEPRETRREVEDSPEGVRLDSLRTGFAHNCGIRSDGTHHCWGAEGAGEFPPEGEGPFSDLALGSFYTCGLQTDREVRCWGHDWERYAEPWIRPGSVTEDWTTEDVLQRTAGIGWVVNTPRTDPPQGEQFKSISGGTWHACGVREDGGISCWGYNRWGQASPPNE